MVTYALKFRFDLRRILFLITTSRNEKFPNTSENTNNSMLHKYYVSIMPGIGEYKGDPKVVGSNTIPVEVTPMPGVILTFDITSKEIIILHYHISNFWK